MMEQNNPQGKKAMILMKLRKLSPRTQAVILGMALAKRKAKDAATLPAQAPSIHER